ncbi:MAG: MarR family transcriptional regulator [Ornithinimicrobium sp.]
MAEPDVCDKLATEMVRTVKVLRATAATLPRLHEAVDPLSHPMLFALLPGPLRVSDLAATVHNDLSTVSRQASTLVDHGLVTKLSDPADGRAQLLELSPAGHDLVRQARRARAEVFEQLVAGWEVEDVRRFTGYLQTFADSVVAQHLGRESAELGNPR